MNDASDILLMHIFRHVAGTVKRQAIKYLPKSARKVIMNDLFYRDSALAKQHDPETFDSVLAELEETHKDVDGFARVMTLSLDKIRAQALHPLANDPSFDQTNNMSEASNSNTRLQLDWKTCSIPQMLVYLDMWSDNEVSYIF